MNIWARWLVSQEKEILLHNFIVHANSVSKKRIKSSVHIFSSTHNSLKIMSRHPFSFDDSEIPQLVNGVSGKYYFWSLAFAYEECVKYWGPTEFLKQRSISSLFSILTGFVHPGATSWGGGEIKLIKQAQELETCNLGEYHCFYCCFTLLTLPVSQQDSALDTFTTLTMLYI